MLSSGRRAVAPRNSAKVRCEMPLLLRKSILFPRADGSEVRTLDLIWTTPARWARNPSRNDPCWRPVRVGFFLLVLRLS